MKEYCDSMQKKLDAWRVNVQKLLVIAETLTGGDAFAHARRIEDLQSLVQDIERVSLLLKRECLPA